jgi:hypothetical protein
VEEGRFSGIKDISPFHQKRAARPCNGGQPFEKLKK